MQIVENMAVNINWQQKSLQNDIMQCLLTMREKCLAFDAANSKVVQQLDASIKIALHNFVAPIKLDKYAISANQLQLLHQE